MPVQLKSITLWRKEAENSPGVLARTLEPIANARADLQVIMGYRHPGDPKRAAIELYPVSGKKLIAAAKKAGLAPSSIPTLLVQGDNKPGLAHSVAQAIADAGVNLSFWVAQVVGRRYAAVIGFDNDADAKKAAALIKKVTGKKKR